MSKLIPWSRFVQRKKVDVPKLLSRFQSYEEFSGWFVRLGGMPPSREEVSKYFEQSTPAPILKSPPVKKPKANLKAEKPTVSMKNTKVQLVEMAAAHNVVVSYYETKAKILQKMKDSNKFIVSLSKK